MPAFVLPDLGEGLTEAEIVAWHVRVGDVVAVDQEVVEVETAKAVVEIPVPFAGRVAELHAGPGDLLAVGDPLITVSDDQAGSGLDGESGNVLIGYGTTAPRPRRRRPARHEPTPATESTAPFTESPANSDGAHPNGRVPVVSPIVRRLARNAGIDLASIRGSGRDGLVTRRDVEEAAAGIRSAVPASPVSASPGPASPGPASPGPASPGPVTGSEQVIRIPLQGIRKVTADKLSRSRREIPEATVWVDADATELLRLRASLNAEGAEPKISLLALLSRFAILGLRRHPELNAKVEDDVIVMGSSVHLGFAAQTDRGLLVPVVAGAQARTLEELSAALADSTLRARAGTLRPAELTGGTFTINNYGVFGVDGSAAIINHPEVAILGIGRIIERPWIVDGQLAARQLTQLTLSFDHRVCDGQAAGGFLRFVADCVESRPGSCATSSGNGPMASSHGAEAVIWLSRSLERAMRASRSARKPSMATRFASTVARSSCCRRRLSRTSSRRLAPLVCS
jgi:2-oxoisovalerate dehydrogenase E2 component (dihydrolipoyl transacylase)